VSFSGRLFLSGALFILLFVHFLRSDLIHCPISDRRGIGAYDRHIRNRNALETRKTLSNAKKCGEKKKKMGQKTRDVRSQIGRENRLKTMIFRLQTLQRREKPCPISKKVGKTEKRVLFCFPDFFEIGHFTRVFCEKSEIRHSSTMMVLCCDLVCRTTRTGNFTSRLSKTEPEGGVRERQFLG